MEYEGPKYLVEGRKNLTKELDEVKEHGEKKDEKVLDENNEIVEAKQNDKKEERKENIAKNKNVGYKATTLLKNDERYQDYRPPDDELVEDSNQLNL